jgi:hypothetical protein
MFAQSGSASKIGAVNITFDANATARNAATGTVTCGFFDFFGTVNNSQWNSCDFLDAGRSSMNWSNSTDHLFWRCHFLGSRRTNVTLTACSRVHFDQCLFNGYFSDASVSSNPSYPSISLQNNGNNCCSDLKFTDCDWITQEPRATFAIEAVADISVRNYHEMQVLSCTFTGTGSEQGTGISGAIGYSQIIGNKWFNGGLSHRCGIEIVGDGNTIAENQFYAASSGAVSQQNYTNIIALGRSPSRGLIYNNTVNNNIIDISISANPVNTSSVSGIAIYGQSNFTITDNLIRITPSSGFEGRVQAGIYLGTVGTSGPLRFGVVTGNLLSNTSNASGRGIRLLTGLGQDGLLNGINYGDNIEITGNSITGFTSSILLPSTSNDTNISVFNNKMLNGGAAISGTLTGTGCIVSATYPYIPPAATASEAGLLTANQFTLLENTGPASAAAITSSDYVLGIDRIKFSPAFVRSIGASNEVAAAMEAFSNAMPKGQRTTSLLNVEQGVIELAAKQFVLEKPLVIDLALAAPSRHGLTIRGQGNASTCLLVPSTATAAAFRLSDGIWRAIHIRAADSSTINNFQIRDLMVAFRATSAPNGSTPINEPIRIVDIEYVPNSKLESVSTILAFPNETRNDQYGFSLNSLYYSSMQNLRATAFATAQTGTTVSGTTKNRLAGTGFRLRNNNALTMLNCGVIGMDLGFHLVSENGAYFSGGYCENHNKSFLFDGESSGCVVIGHRTEFSQVKSLFPLEENMYFAKFCEYSYGNQAQIATNPGLGILKIDNSAAQNNIVTALSEGGTSTGVSVQNDRRHEYDIMAGVSMTAGSGVTVSTNADKPGREPNVTSSTQLVSTGSYNQIYKAPSAITIDPSVGLVRFGVWQKRVSGAGMLTAQLSTVSGATNSQVRGSYVQAAYSYVYAANTFGTTVKLQSTGHSWSSNKLTILTAAPHGLQPGMRVQSGSSWGTLAAGVNLYVDSVTPMSVTLIAELGGSLANPGTITNPGDMSIPSDMVAWRGAPNITDDWQRLEATVIVRQQATNLSLNGSNQAVVQLASSMGALAAGTKLRLSGFADSRLNVDYTIVAGDISGLNITLTGLGALTGLVIQDTGSQLEPLKSFYGFVGLTELYPEVRCHTTNTGQNITMRFAGFSLIANSSVSDTYPYTVTGTGIILRPPSGDLTGATDSANIEAAISMAMLTNGRLHIPKATYVINRDVLMVTGLHITMQPGAVIKSHDPFTLVVTSNSTNTVTTTGDLSRVLVGMHVLEDTADLSAGNAFGCTPGNLRVTAVGANSITFSSALTASGVKTLKFYFRGNVITADTVTNWSITTGGEGGWGYLDGNRSGQYPYHIGGQDNVGNGMRIVNCNDYYIDGICGRNTRYHGLIAVGKLYDGRIGRWRGEDNGYRAIHYHGENVGGAVNEEAHVHVELIECDTTGVSAFANQGGEENNSGAFMTLSNVAKLTIGTIRARESYGAAVMLSGTNDSLPASNNSIIGAILSDNAAIGLGFYSEVRAMQVGQFVARGKYTKFTGCATLDATDLTHYYMPSSGTQSTYALRRVQLPAGAIASASIRPGYRLYMSSGTTGSVGGGLQIMKVSVGTGPGGTDLVWVFRDGGTANPYTTVASGFPVYIWTCRGTGLYFDQSTSTKQIKNIKLGAVSLEWAGRSAVSSTLSSSECRYRDISIGSLTIDGTAAFDQWNSFAGITIGHYTQRNRTNGLVDESATLTGDVWTKFQNSCNVTIPVVYTDYTIAGANNYIGWQFDLNCRNLRIGFRGIHPSASAATIDCAIPSGAGTNAAGFAGPLVLDDPRTKTGAQVAVSATGIVRVNATSCIIVRPSDTP